MVPIMDRPPVSVQEDGEGGYPDKGCQEDGDDELGWKIGHLVSSGNGGCSEEKEGEASS